MTDPYRIAGLPGEPSKGPDVWLDQSETALFEQWSVLAEQRAKLVEILQKSAPITQQSPNEANVGALTLCISQLALVDSEMNGIGICRMFQRLRGAR